MVPRMLEGVFASRRARLLPASAWAEILDTAPFPASREVV
jgi:hypothetical protein